MIGIVTAGTPQQLPVTKDSNATSTNATAGSIAGETYGATESIIKSDIPICSSTFCKVSAETIIPNISIISPKPPINASENSEKVSLLFIMYMAEATTVPITTPTRRSTSKYSVPAIRANIGMTKSHTLAALSGS